MSQWPKAQLRRAFRVVNGGTPDGDSANWGGEVAWATPVDLAKVHGGVLEETERTLTERGLASGSRAIPAGSLLLSTRAPIGYVAEAAIPTSFNQGCRGLVPTGDVVARFFRYQLEAATARLTAAGQGSTFVELSGDALAAFEVVVPPFSAQRAIADFLDTETARIDALITKKRRLIELLEERFHGIVDDALAPWPHRPLKRFVSYVEGPGIMAEDFRDEGTPLLRVANLSGPTVTLEGCNFLDPEMVRRKWAQFAVRAGDYLISASASMGTVALVDETAAGGIPYTGIIRFRPSTDQVHMRFVKFFLASRGFLQQIELMRTGVAIQHFGPTHLGSVAIPIPPFSEMIRIASSLEDEQIRLEALQHRLRHQIELLVEHRQALITAAVTGEIEVPGAA